MSPIFQFVIFLGVFGACSAKAVNVSTLIYGGQQANDGMFPYQVYLELGEYVCGGAIYDQNTVVTAAHCLFDRNGNMHPYYTVYAFAGSVNRGKGQKIQARGTWAHQNYRPNAPYWDIAVIKLSSSFSYNNNVQPIKIAQSGLKYTSGTCVLTGFGSTTTNKGPVSDRLLYAPINLKADSSCSASDPGQYDSTSMICGGGDGTNQCSGDSGGPLVCNVNGNNFLYGAVSRGPTNCAARQPGSYSSVSYYNSWISSTARN